jgi:hypothetical protein
MNRRDAVKGLTAAALTPAIAAVASGEPVQDDKQGTLILRDAPVRQALEMLLIAYRRSYMIDNAVSGLISVVARNHSFEQQFRTLLQLGKLRWTQENGVYRISAGSGVTDAASPANAASPTRRASDAQPNRPYRVLGVRYERTAEGNILNPLGIVEITPHSGGVEIYVVKPGDILPTGLDPSAKETAKFTKLRIDEIHPGGMTVVLEEEKGEKAATFQLPLALGTHFRIGPTF